MSKFSLYDKDGNKMDKPIINRFTDKKPKDDNIKFHMTAKLQSPTFWTKEKLIGSIEFIRYRVDSYYFNTGSFVICLN